MNLKFKKPGHAPFDDVFEYCIVQTLKPNLRVYIGTDSISKDGNLHYFTVIAFRTGRVGAHFIYNKTTLKSFKDEGGKPDIFNKLWTEARFTIELAELLVEKGIFTREAITLEFDYQSVTDTISKKLNPAVTGWASGLGYAFTTKYNRDHQSLSMPDQVAVKAANYLCQKV